MFYSFLFIVYSKINNFVGTMRITWKLWSDSKTKKLYYLLILDVGKDYYKF